MAIINGTAGNDLLLGSEVSDVLSGREGNDTLYGGVGNDSLDGGSGADKFVFDSTLNATTNKNTILDFSHAQGDKILLDNDVFTRLGSALGNLSPDKFVLGTAALQTDDPIHYYQDSGALFYDRDGSVNTYGPVQFAVLSTHPALTSSDLQVID